MKKLTKEMEISLEDLFKEEINDLEQGGKLKKGNITPYLSSLSKQGYKVGKYKTKYNEMLLNYLSKN